MKPLEATERTAERYGISVKEILGTTRRAWVVRARKELSFLLREMGMNDAEVGRFMGKNHTTIRHYFKKVKIKV